MDPVEKTPPPFAVVMYTMSARTWKLSVPPSPSKGK
jgi:hypothetical protein